MKKCLNILLASAMLASILSGCSGSGTPSNDSGSTSSSGNGETKVIQLGHVNPGSEEDNLNRASGQLIELVRKC